MKESGTYIMLYDGIKIQEKSISQVARETGMSRNTIKKYLREGEKVHKNVGKAKPSKLDDYKPAIRQLLAAGIYNATVIHERISDMGYTGGISILRDFIKPLRPPALKTGTAVRRFGTKPGKQAQMDWGILKYLDNGKIKKVACFVMILGHSRMKFIAFSRRCDEDTLCVSIVVRGTLK